MSRAVETAVVVSTDRHLPPQVIAQQVQALQGSGVVDGVLLPDQLQNFIPPQLWNPGQTELATLMPDPDSFSDVFAMAAYIAAAAPDLTVTIATDAIRRGPAELTQTMLTLANLTSGKAGFHIGGGEAKQCKAYGHKRSQGISRMGDLFAIYNRFMDNPGEPFDYEGKRWTFKNATLGHALQHRPRVLGLGGGPMLIDHVTTHVDGLAVCCPSVWAGAELFAEERAKILKTVEEKGRDPEQFRFEVWFPGLLTADEDMLDRAMEHDLVKWLSSFFGRVDTGLWPKEGLENPLPRDDWAYYVDLLPYETGQALIDEVLAKTTRAHVERSWVYGTPEHAAGQIQEYIDAGADWVCAMDYTPVISGLADAEAAFVRGIELCGAIKSRNAAAAAAA